MFIFTDNITAEGTISKGNNPYRFLFELVLKLRFAEMKYRFCAHVACVSGSRMIEQGTYGLSKGDL